MARTISWLPRIDSIARRIAGSARSHYDRAEIEHLFQVQPRSAQNLMALLPTVPIGRARLVEREALSAFLERMAEAEDPAHLHAELQAGKGRLVRRKLRTLKRQDVAGDLDLLPSSITLVPGEMRVSFRTVDELAEALLNVAVILETQLDRFAAIYEQPKELGAYEVARINDECSDAEYLRDWK